MTVPSTRIVSSLGLATGHHRGWGRAQGTPKKKGRPGRIHPERLGGKSGDEELSGARGGAGPPRIGQGCLSVRRPPRFGWEVGPTRIRILLGRVVEVLGAVIATLVTAPFVRRMAIRLGVVDHPGPLKTHRAAVPYLGGVAVFLGLIVGPVGAGRIALLVPYGLAMALGVVDDIRGLPPRARLGAEVLIGLVAGVLVPGPAVAKVATAVLVVVLLNAVNMLDGQDGLATASCLVSAAAFASLGGDAKFVGLALAGALAAFLVFNAPPARMYLGDGGAYLIGTVLATLPALTHHGSTSLSVWVATPLIVALPLADGGIAVLRRLRAGAPLFQGDRNHVYDQLANRGWRRESATAICVLFQGGLAVLGVIVAGLDLRWALAVAAASVVISLGLATASGLIGKPTA
jgi:UDP-GlcNAc:undecaprenyl-phosphate GlcNAc-1-phosphate transferase